MKTADSAPVRGLVLGKFMPPHMGHLHLVDFAAAWCDELTVVVGTLESEPLDGRTRWRWMRELCPDATVVHLTDDNPQDPSEHPDFWGIWERSLRRILPTLPDVVFASEAYGWTLAEVLGARFVPVDPGRSAITVSGTSIRANPLKHWDYLPPPVRAHYALRVSIFGPESTGKSTLATALAEHFDTAHVPEYARTWLEAHGRDPTADDMPLIARGQASAEAALARRCNRLLVCDTDPLATVLWSEVLFGECNAEVTRIAASTGYDLTVLMTPDVPWVEDPVRYLPGGGAQFFERSREMLSAAGRPVLVVSGDFSQRTAAAIAAIRALLDR